MMGGVYEERKMAREDLGGRETKPLAYLHGTYAMLLHTAGPRHKKRSNKTMPFPTAHATRHQAGRRGWMDGWME